MSQARFDPYYVWLGIPPDQQPPTHYRLLGLAPLEANGDVIANAAEQRMAHLRTVQIGPHAAESQRLLGEITTAMRVLLDPARKAAYDAELRQQVSIGPASASKAPSAAGAGPLPMSAPSRPPPRSERVAATSAKPLPEGGDAPRSWLPVVLISGGIVAALGALVVVAAIGLIWRLWDNAATVAQQRNVRPPVVQPSISPPIIETPLPDDNEIVPADPVVDETAPPVDEPPPVAANEPPVTRPVEEPEPTPPVEPAETEPVAEEPTSTNEPTENGAPQRATPPTVAEQKLLLHRLAEVYPPTDVKTAKQSVELAEELLELGSDAATPAAERFVLMRRAAELAVAGRDANLLSSAVAQMAATFDVNAIDVEGSLLIRMAADIDVSSSSAFARSASTFAGLAASDQRYDMAARVLATVTALPPSVLGETARANAQKQLDALRQRESRFIAIAAAERAVIANPTDAAAHALLAQWYCFQQQDWPRGVAHLARGSDANLRKIAELELAGAPSPAARLAIANQWWDAAQSASADDKSHYEARAYHWYQLVEASEVSGLDRALLAKRLETLTASHSTPDEETSDGAADGERFDALFAKAMDAVREKRYGDADRLFAHCVRLRPADAAAANNYALTAVRIGQSQRAVKQWERTLAAGVSAVGTLHNLERFRAVIDRDKLPIDRASSTTLDKLIESARSNARLAKYRPSSGWQYEQLGGAAAYDDRYCMYCNGQATVDCPVRGCSRGKIRVMQSRVVGRNTVTGEAIVQSSSVGVPCRDCGGDGTVKCKQCSGGIDRRLH